MRCSLTRSLCNFTTRFVHIVKIISKLSPPRDLNFHANNESKNKIELSQTMNVIISNCMWESGRKTISATAHNWGIRQTKRKKEKKRKKMLFTIHWKSILNYYCRKNANNERRKTSFYYSFRLFARTCKHYRNTSHGNFRPSR